MLGKHNRAGLENAVALWIPVPCSVPGYLRTWKTGTLERLSRSVSLDNFIFLLSLRQSIMYATHKAISLASRMCNWGDGAGRMTAGAGPPLTRIRAASQMNRKQRYESAAAEQKTYLLILL